MHIFSRDVLKRITSGQDDWEEMLPEGIAEVIKKKKLFMGDFTEKKEEEVEEAPK